MIRSQKLAYSLLSRRDRPPQPCLRGTGHLDAVDARTGAGSTRERMLELTARLAGMGCVWQIPLRPVREEQTRPAHRSTSAPDGLSAALRVAEGDSQVVATPSQRLERARSGGSVGLPNRAQSFATRTQDRPSVNALVPGAGTDRLKTAVGAFGGHTTVNSISPGTPDGSGVIPKTGGSSLASWPGRQPSGEAGIMPIAMASAVTPAVAVMLATSSPLPSMATLNAVAGGNRRAALTTAPEVLAAHAMQPGMMPSALQAAAAAPGWDPSQTPGRGVVVDTGSHPGQHQAAGYRDATGLGSATTAARIPMSPLPADRRAGMQQRVIPPVSPYRKHASIGDASSYSGSAVAQPGPAPGNFDSSHGGEANMSVAVNLSGDVVIDGRRLGRLTASSQAREASLPARGPSRVNLRAVPVFSGTQIPG